MSLTRVSPEQLNARRERISRLKDEIRTLEAYAADAKSELWTKRLGPALKATMAANQEKIERLLDEPTMDPASDLANIKALRGGMKAYQHIWDTIERNESTINAKRDTVQRLAEEIKTIEQEQGI